MLVSMQRNIGSLRVGDDEKFEVESHRAIYERVERKWCQRM